jgi:hypothetical protein
VAAVTKIERVRLEAGDADAADTGQRDELECSQDGDSTADRQTVLILMIVPSSMWEGVLARPFLQYPSFMSCHAG